MDLDKVRTPFRIHYKTAENGYVIYAAEWDKEERIWKLWYTESWGISWELYGLLDEEARKGLLERFALAQWQDKLPLEIMSKMSPRELIVERKVREVVNNLSKIEVKSDGMGRLPAEVYD